MTIWPVGHILGLSHDGDKGAGNQCMDEASHGSVMAPMVGATFRDRKCRLKFHATAVYWS